MAVNGFEEWEGGMVAYSRPGVSATSVYSMVDEHNYYTAFYFLINKNLDIRY